MNDRKGADMAHDEQTPEEGRGRRGLLLTGAGVVLAVALAALVLLFGGGDDDGDPAAAGTGTPQRSEATAPPTPTTLGGTSETTSEPTAEPSTGVTSDEPSTGVTSDATELPPVLPEVPLDAQAGAGDGVVATLPRIEEIQGSAEGPGNVSGPALRVTVRIANGTADPVTLDGVAVNLFYGPTRTPASPLEDASQRSFTGSLEPGGSADGVYVFSVPADARDAVAVEVGYQVGAPFLLFTGSVG
jgi:hypothetical protein